MRETYYMLVTFTYAGNEKWYWSDENKNNMTAYWTLLEQYAQKFPSPEVMPIVKAKASIKTMIHIETVTRTLTNV